MFRFRGSPKVWLQCLCGLLVMVLSVCGIRAAERPPNVVLILADDLGWADLGCYGSRFHKTPNLDRMAAEGVRFTQAYAACPVCSPTRAAVMTGKYPQRFNLTDWLPGRPDQPSQRLKRPVIRQELPLEAVTLAEILKEAGYVTGHIGKWHLGGKGFGPLEQGFLSNIGGDHTGTPLSYFAPFQRNGQVMPGLENAPEGEYLTDRYAAEAEKFIEQHQAKPFFLYLPHNAVHTPLRANPEVVAQFKEAAEKLGPGTQRNPVYAAMLSSLDEAVGRVIKKLDDLKLSENTIVIFTSDNGGLATLEGMPAPATINSPLREGKGYLYEGGIRVPLLIKWPGKIKPAVSTAVSSSIDLLPTITDACLGKNAAEVDGVSLLPELLQTEKIASRDLFWHYPHYANQGSRPGGAIRSGDYKLIRYYEDGRVELFNVVKDVGESNNLISEQSELVKELAEKLQVWSKQVDAQPMTKNPDYVPNPQAKDGTITLHARTASVTGVQLRYEPLPHKETLGFWVNPKNTASFEFTVTKPGNFEVEVLQGCGTGSGGSEVTFIVGEQKLVMTVHDTGHFQNFVPRVIGTIELKDTGRYSLIVQPISKPGVAVMDLRQVKLTPK